MSFASGIAEIERRIIELGKRVKAAPYVRWGVVTSIAPIAVQLDADPQPLAGSPASTVSGLVVADRGQVLVQASRATIIGRARATKWLPLPLSSGVKVYDTQTPQYLVRDGRLHLRGAVAPTSGSFTTSYVTLAPIGAIPPLPGVRHGYNSVRTVPSGAGSPAGRMYIGGSGDVLIATTGGTASYYLLNSTYEIES